ITTCCSCASALRSPPSGRPAPETTTRSGRAHLPWPPDIYKVPAETVGEDVTDEDFSDIRHSVRSLCARFPGEYWRGLDRERRYPGEFVRALTEAGMLAVLIPEEYGGSGLGIAAAAAILEEIHRSG